MINVNIYEILGQNEDPLYEHLHKLHDNEEFKIGRHTVRKTEKFYEIENEDFHENFVDMIGCYQFINTLSF